jgi:hypothetical protein
MYVVPLMLALPFIVGCPGMDMTGGNGNGNMNGNANGNMNGNANDNMNVNDNDNGNGKKPATSFAAQLVGREEVPEVETEASGSAELEVNMAGDGVDFTVQVSGGVGITASHIHRGARGENGEVVAFLVPMGTAPGDVDGLLAEGTITAADLVGPLAGMSIDDLLAEMRAGNAYVNVHSEANPGGEIRGQIQAN